MSFRPALALTLLLAPLAAAAAPAEDASPWEREIHRRIHARWSGFLKELPRLADPAFRDPKIAVELELSLLTDGRVASVGQLAALGPKGFVDAPLDLIRDLGVLPAPPAALRSDDGRVHLRIRFARTLPACAEVSVLHRRLPPEVAIPALIGDGRVEDAIARVREARGQDPDRGGALVDLLAAELARRGAVDPDPALRAASAPVLARLDDGEPRLAALLRDRTPSVRRAALAALGTGGAPVGTHLVLAAIAALGDPALRVEAIRALGRLDDPGAVPPLRAALREGRSPEECVPALIALGQGAAAEEDVAILLSGSAAERSIGARGARALRSPQVEPVLVADLAGASPALRVELLGALAALGERVSPPSRVAVMRALLDPMASVRSEAVVALSRVDPRGPGTRLRLVDLLRDPDPGVRAAAGAGLAERGAESEDTAWELARLARDPVAGVRAALAVALAARPTRATANLIGRLQRDPDASVRAAFAPKANVVSGPGAPAHAVERLLGTSDPLERLAAAAALRQPPPPRHLHARRD